MKLHLIPILLALFTIIATTSCSKSDSDFSDSDLVGDWNMTSMTYDGGDTDINDYSGYAKNISYRLYFFEDPQSYQTAGGYTTVQTYNTAEPYTEETVFSGIGGLGHWEIKGSEIEGFLYEEPAFDDWTESTVTIVELTETTLELEWNYSSAVPGNSEVNLITKMTFDRF